MIRKFYGLWFAVCLAALLIMKTAYPVFAADPLQEFPSRVKKITLKNGMRVLILERPSSPTISFSMYIRTGGMDDESGKSGLAHMFEHMLFKGTKTIGTKNYEKEVPVLDEMDKVMEQIQFEMEKKSPSNERLQALHKQFDEMEKKHQSMIVEEEFWKIYERAGAQNFNASTGYDYTNYVISLPVNQLKLWMAMEHDRIQNPVLREFYKERNVVLEERRQRTENSPQGKLWEAFLAAAFEAHPYGRPVIGWESDISRVTRKDAEDFFKRHYDVSRLVVAIVGGIKASQVEAMAREYLEVIPSHGRYAESRVPEEPPQEGVRRVEVEFNAEPSVLIGYHRPDMMSSDSAVFDVISEILDAGRTSRFNKSIVEDRKIAVSAWAGSSTPGERAPNVFVMGGSPRSPHTSEDLIKALESEIEKLKKEGPTVPELEKVKTNLEASLLRQLADNPSMAEQLAYYECLAGDWTYVLTSVGKIRAVTAEDVKRVAAQYLVRSNETISVLVKKPK